VQIKKSFKPTSIGPPKKRGLKFLPKSCEKTLSNKSKLLYEMKFFMPNENFFIPNDDF